MIKTSIIFMVFALAFIPIAFIPSWQKFETHVFLFIWSGAALFSSFHIFSFLEYTKKTIRIRQPLNSLYHALVSLLLVFAIISTLLLWLVNEGEYFFGAELDRIELINGEQLIIYHNYCFIPDSACECDDYYSLIYLKNSYLPIMHLKGKPKFYAGEIDIVDDAIIVNPSNICSQDEKEKMTLQL